MVSPKSNRTMPPAIWKAGRLMPIASIRNWPVTMKNNKTPAATIAAWIAIIRRSAGLLLAVAAMKIGTIPMGFMMTKRTTNCSSTLSTICSNRHPVIGELGIGV